jgi:DNA-binding MarR family transcriptional regulator
MPRPAPAETALIAETCACFNLRKAARAVTQAYDDAIAPSGLKITQLSVLVALSLAAGAPLGKLAGHLGMDRTTLTRNLRPLERRRLIRSERGPDQRERRFQLTDAGQAMLERAMPLWQAAQARLVGRFGAARWSTMRGELDAIASAAQA